MILICDDKLLTFALMFLTTVMVACEKKILTFIAHERGKVDLRCPYKSGYEEKKKYLCSGGCILGFKNIPVESGSPAEDQRFSLTDDTAKRVFTVTITDLRTEDGGQYWCGIKTELSKSDDYTEIDLKIRHLSRVSAVSGQNVSISCHYEHDLMDDAKFICKGSDPSLCVKSATKVSSEMSISGRFSLKDDQYKRALTVSIRDLTEEDSGIYWCGALEGKTHTWISVKELNISNVSPEEESPTETTTHSFHSSKPTEMDSDRAATSPSSSSSTSSSSTSSSSTSSSSTSSSSSSSSTYFSSTSSSTSLSSQTTSPSSTSLSSSTSSSSTSSSTSSQTTSSLLMLGITSANEVFTVPESGFTAVIMLIAIGTLTGFGFTLFLYFIRRQKKEGMQPKDVILLQINHPSNGDLQKT